MTWSKETVEAVCKVIGETIEAEWSHIGDIKPKIARSALSAIEQSKEVQELVEAMRFVRGNIATQIGIHQLSLGWRSSEGVARKIHAMQKERALIDSALKPFTKEAVDE